jgi:hypothetical protein
MQLVELYVRHALDADVRLRDAQILARHADPRTTEHYDRARATSTATASTSSPCTSPSSSDYLRGWPMDT